MKKRLTANSAATVAAAISAIAQCSIVGRMTTVEGNGGKKRERKLDCGTNGSYVACSTVATEGGRAFRQHTTVVLMMPAGSEH
jgi:hypothetical protein